MDGLHHAREWPSGENTIMFGFAADQRTAGPHLVVEGVRVGTGGGVEDRLGVQVTLAVGAAQDHLDQPVLQEPAHARPRVHGSDRSAHPERRRTTATA
jgi:hypothetical protein